MVDSEEGFVFHPDPDVLSAYELGFHDYDTISDAKTAYVTGELSHIEFRAVLTNLI